MELNREQIIKALECCLLESNCRDCPLHHQHEIDCLKYAGVKALALIKELTEKVENYRNELGEVRFALAEANNDKKELTEENERLRSANEELGRHCTELVKENKHLINELTIAEVRLEGVNNGG